MLELAKMTDHSNTRPTERNHSTEHCAEFDFPDLKQHENTTISLRSETLPDLSCHFQAHEQLEEVKLEAVQDNNVELVTEILGDISSLKVKDDSAAELSRILQEPHFQVSRHKCTQVNSQPCAARLNLCSDTTQT